MGSDPPDTPQLEEKDGAVPFRLYLAFGRLIGLLTRNPTNDFSRRLPSAAVVWFVRDSLLSGCAGFWYNASTSFTEEVE